MIEGANHTSIKDLEDQHLQAEKNFQEFFAEHREVIDRFLELLEKNNEASMAYSTATSRV